MKCPATGHRRNKRVCANGYSGRSGCGKATRDLCDHLERLEKKEKKTGGKG